MKLIGIKSKLSTAYHPQTDRAKERAMQEIEEYLSIYCLSHPTDWLEALSTLKFTYNRRPHVDRECSPFELMMGFQSTRIPDTFSETKFPDLEQRTKLLTTCRKEAEAV